MNSLHTGAVHTVRLSGELNLATTSGVEAELKRVDATDARPIGVDLSASTFIDSSEVRCLVDAEIRPRASNGLTLPAVRRRCNDSSRSSRSTRRIVSVTDRAVQFLRANFATDSCWRRL